MPPFGGVKEPTQPRHAADLIPEPLVARSVLILPGEDVFAAPDPPASLGIEVLEATRFIAVAEEEPAVFDVIEPRGVVIEPPAEPQTAVPTRLVTRSGGKGVTGGLGGVSGLVDDVFLMVDIDRRLAVSASLSNKNKFLSEPGEATAYLRGER